MTPLPKTDSLDLDLIESWLSVWFNSPNENRNALTDERADELRLLCEILQQRRDIRGVTFRGRGEMFCAGGDLKSFKRAVSGSADRDSTLKLSRSAGKLYRSVFELPQLTLMAVEGACVAGGLGLACCGDIVICNADTTFALTEVRIGLAPAQIAPFVVERIGMSATRRLALTGAMFDGREAKDIALVDHVTEDNEQMDEAIAAVVEQSAACAPGAVSATKTYLQQLPEMNRDEQIEAAAQVFADCMLSDEGREGLSAFAEKRQPRWAAKRETSTKKESA